MYIKAKITLIIQTGILAFCINSPFAEDIYSIEDLVNSPEEYNQKHVVIDGYAASLDCYQISTGGCSGTPCVSDLVVQTEESGGPAITLIGTYNGLNCIAASDGCELSSSPLIIGWKYRIWGTFIKITVSGSNGTSAFAIDSFKVIEKGSYRNIGDEISNKSILVEGVGNYRYEYKFDSTLKSGYWTYLRSPSSRYDFDQPFDTLSKGSFSCAIKNGVWDGDWIQYYSNGTLRSRGKYVNGAKEGEWVEYDSSGSILSKGSFLHGHEIGVWEKRLLPSGTKLFIDYTKKNTIEITKILNESQKQAIAIIDKHVKSLMKIEHFYHDGKIKKSVEIEEKTKNTIQKEWSKSGKIIAKQLYVDGEFTDSLWYETGKLWKVKKRYLNKKSGVFTEWYKNGQIKWSGLYNGFKPNGRWVNFDEKGKEITVINYNNGLLKDTSVHLSDVKRNLGKSIQTLNGKLVKSELQKEPVIEILNDFTNIRSLVIDSNHVWAGTNGGILCLDKNGKIIRAITTADGLPANRITALEVDRRKCLWAGTEQYLLSSVHNYSSCCINIIGRPLLELINQNNFFEDSSSANWNEQIDEKQCKYNSISALTDSGWQYFNEGNGNELVSSVYNIVAGYDGTIWYSGIDGFKKVGDSLSEKIKNRLNTSVSKITIDKDSSLWFISFDTLFHLKGDSLQAYKPSDYFPSGELINLYSVEPNHLYLLCSQSILEFVNNRFFLRATFKDINVNLKSSFYHLKSGEFIFATDKGLISYNHQGNVKYIATKGDLQNSEITTFVKDSSNYWVGTKNGIYKIINYKTVKIQIPDGLPVENIQGVNCVNDKLTCVQTNDRIFRIDNASNIKSNSFSDSNNNIRQILTSVTLPDSSLFIGTSNLLFKVVNDKIYDLSFKNALAHGTITSLTIDKNNTIYYVLDRYQIVRFDGKKFEILHKQVEEIDGAINSITVDALFNIWYSDQNGIYVLRNNRIIKEYSCSQGLPFLPITQILVGKKGTYASSIQAVYKLEDGRWRSILTEDNLNGVEINTMTEDVIGRIWIGTSDGLIMYNNKFNYCTFKNNLPGKRIMHLSSDQKNTLWVVTENGLCKLRELKE